MSTRNGARRPKTNSGSRRGRQVLIPGTRKASPHPWSARLRAAMDGKTKPAVRAIYDEAPSW